MSKNTLKSSAPLRVGILATEPPVADNGTLFYNSSENLLKMRENGAWERVASRAYVDATTDLIQNFEWQPSVLAIEVDSAEIVSPSMGDRYLIAGVGLGDFSGHDNAIAQWDGSAWVFTPATIGMMVSVDAESDSLRLFDGLSWSQKYFELTTAANGLEKNGFEISIASSAAGSALSFGGGIFDVNVDSSTIEVAIDSLRVKADGIDQSHILLDNNSYLRGLSSDGSSSVDLLKVDSSDAIQMASFMLTPANAPSADYQVANKKFVDDEIATVNSTIDALDLQALTDVVLTSSGSGQLLRYDGSNWVNEAPVSAYAVASNGTAETAEYGLMGSNLTGYGIGSFTDGVNQQLVAVLPSGPGAHLLVKKTPNPTTERIDLEFFQYDDQIPGYVIVSTLPSAVGESSGPDDYLYNDNSVRISANGSKIAVSRFSSSSNKLDFVISSNGGVSWTALSSSNKDLAVETGWLAMVDFQVFNDGSIIMFDSGYDSSTQLYVPKVRVFDSTSQSWANYNAPSALRLGEESFDPHSLAFAINGSDYLIVCKDAGVNATGPWKLLKSSNRGSSFTETTISGLVNAESTFSYESQYETSPKQFPYFETGGGLVIGLSDRTDPSDQVVFYRISDAGVATELSASQTMLAFTTSMSSKGFYTTGFGTILAYVDNGSHNADYFAVIITAGSPAEAGSASKIVKSNTSGYLDQSLLQYNIDFGGNRLSGVATPTQASDAASKGYTDGLISSLSSTVAALNLDALTDVVISSASSGQILRNNGSLFVNETPIAVSSGSASADKMLISDSAGRLDQTFLQYNIDFGGNRLSGVATPTQASDAASKGYTDGLISSLSSTVAALNLDALTDVVISSASSGQILRNNGSLFVNETPIAVSSGSASADKMLKSNSAGRLDQTLLQYNIDFGGNRLSGVATPTQASDAVNKAFVDALVIDNLADVTITSVSSGQVLRNNGSQWVNEIPLRQYATSDSGSIIETATSNYMTIAAGAGYSQAERQFTQDFNSGVSFTGLLPLGQTFNLPGSLAKVKLLLFRDGPITGNLRLRIYNGLGVGGTLLATSNAVSISTIKLWAANSQPTWNPSTGAVTNITETEFTFPSLVTLTGNATMMLYAEGLNKAFGATAFAIVAYNSTASSTYYPNGDYVYNSSGGTSSNHDILFKTVYGTLPPANDRLIMTNASGRLDQTFLQYNVDFGGNRLSGVAAPTQSSDAVNLDYLNTALDSLSSTLQDAYGFGSTITTNSSSGSVTIAGSEKLVVSTSGGLDVTGGGVLGGLISNSSAGGSLELASGAGGMLILTATSGSSNGAIALKASGTEFRVVENGEIRIGVNSSDFMSQVYKHLIILPNSGSSEALAELGFDSTVYQGVEISYSMASNVGARVGHILVTTDGSNTSIADSYTETADLGVVFSAVMDGSDVVVSVENTSADAADMRALLKKFQAIGS